MKCTVMMLVKLLVYDMSYDGGVESAQLTDLLFFWYVWPSGKNKTLQESSNQTPYDPLCLKNAQYRIVSYSIVYEPHTSAPGRVMFFLSLVLMLGSAAKASTKPRKMEKKFQ